VMPREPVRVLILRIWLEQGSPRPFRADIRLTRDAGFAPFASLVLAEPSEVIDTVREFLEPVASRPGGWKRRAFRRITRWSRPSHASPGRLVVEGGHPSQPHGAS
jgi:hypothetical protein